MKRAMGLLLLSVLLAAATLVSGSSDEPVKRRDLRYRPNNAYSYQFTSLHNGNNHHRGEGPPAAAATALSFQHRFERFGDVKRALAPAPIPAAAPPVSLAVIAVSADSNHHHRHRTPRFPISRQRGAVVPPSNGRRTSVDISSGLLMEKKEAVVGVSHSTVVVHHAH